MKQCLQAANPFMSYKIKFEKFGQKVRRTRDQMFGAALTKGLHI